MIKMLRTFIGIKSPSKEFQKGLKTFDPFIFLRLEEDQQECPIKWSEKDGPELREELPSCLEDNPKKKFNLICAGKTIEDLT